MPEKPERGQTHEKFARSGISGPSASPGTVLSACERRGAVGGEFVAEAGSGTHVGPAYLSGSGLKLRFVTPDGETVTDARTLASQLGLLRAMANYDLHRVVTFRSRIRSASAFARSLPEVCAWLPADRRLDGSLWAEHVSGEMASGERDNRRDSNDNEA